MGKPFQYVTSYSDQLSLAIPSWVGAMSTSEVCDVNRHTARCTCTGSVFVVSQCKLVFASGLRKWMSAPPYSSRLEKNFTLHWRVWAKRTGDQRPPMVGKTVRNFTLYLRMSVYVLQRVTVSGTRTRASTTKPSVAWRLHWTLPESGPAEASASTVSTTLQVTSRGQLDVRPRPRPRPERVRPKTRPKPKVFWRQRP